MVDVNLNTPSEDHPFVRRLENKQGKLAFVCLSHFDKDHSSGLDWIVRRWGNEIKIFISLPTHYLGLLQLKALLLEKIHSPHKTNLESCIETLVQQSHTEVFFVDSGRFRRNIGGCEITALWPSPGKLSRVAYKYRKVSRDAKEDIVRSVPSFNGVSIVLQIKYGDMKLLFCGDCERDVYSKFGRGYSLVKLNHHGSYNSFDASQMREGKILLMGRKSVVVVSAPGNKYWPAEEVLSSLTGNCLLVCTNRSIFCNGGSTTTGTLLSKASEVKPSKPGESLMSKLSRTQSVGKHENYATEIAILLGPDGRIVLPEYYTNSCVRNQ